MPTHCPECGTELGRPEGEVDVRCPNTVSCPAQLRESVFHFAGRGAMDIDGLGYETAIALLQAGRLRDVGDVFPLDRRVASRACAASAPKKVEQILRGVEAARDRPVWRLLVGLSIRHVGPTAAQDVARQFRTMDAVMAASPEELAAVEGVGPVVARSLHAWFLDERHREIVERIRAGGARFADEGVRRGPASARGRHGRHHRHAGDLQPRRRDRGGAGARRQGDRQRQQEDRLRRRRHRPRRQQARQGRQARRAGARRRRPARPARAGTRRRAGRPPTVPAAPPARARA